MDTDSMIDNGQTIIGKTLSIMLYLFFKKLILVQSSTEARKTL
jgi:hypothetical protein